MISGGSLGELALGELPDQVAGTSVGDSTVDGIVAVDAIVVGSAVGSALVDGVAASYNPTATSFVGSAIGIGNANSIVVSYELVVGTSVGNSVIAGVIGAVATVRGSLIGSSTVNGIVATDSVTTGVSIGSSIVRGGISSYTKSAGRISAPRPRIVPKQDAIARGASFVIDIRLIDGNSFGTIVVDGKVGAGVFAPARMAIVGGRATGEQNLNDDELLVLLEAA